MTGNRWALLASLLGTLSAGPATADWQNFRGALDGLADNQVWQILEARDGALWFSTPRGASQYDGVRWRTVRDSLPGVSPAVTVVAQEPGGALWFGTETDGAARWDGTRWSHYSNSDVLPSNSVEDLLTDHRGDVWLGTPRGLVRCLPGLGAWTTLTPSNSGLIDLNASSLVEDAQHALWIATPAGVSRLDSTRTTWTSFTAANSGLARDSVLALAEDGTGGMWFGTDLGVFHFAQDAWTRYRVADGLAADSVSVILRDRSGAMWFGGPQGLTRYDGQLWRRIPGTSDGQPLDLVLSLQQDGAGNLWIGTATHGLFRHDGVSWTNYFSTNTSCGTGRIAQSAPYLNTLGSNCLTGMLQDRRGELWFTTYVGGGARYRRTGRWTLPVRRTFSQPISDSLATVFEDRSSRLWFGSLGAGVSMLDSARTAWRVHSRLTGLASDTVFTLFQDQAGVLWAGTACGVGRWTGSAWVNDLTGAGPTRGIEVAGIVEDAAGHLWARTDAGLFTVDTARTTWIQMIRADGLAADSVTALIRTADGRVCAGTRSGLSVFDGVSWTTVPSFGSPADSVVWALHEDHLGRLWIGLENGVAYGSASGWTYVTRQFLAATPVTGIFEDDLGTVWCAAITGVARYNGDTWRTYDSRGDGLAADEVTGFLEDAQGHLWFSSRGGLTEYAPDRVAPQTVFITAPPALTPAQNVSAVFGAAFGEGSDVEYAYEWDGASASPWSSEVSWSRTGVADGMHRLVVRARDWARNVDLAPAVLDFEVDATPPAAVLSAPLFGQPVRGTLDIRGSAADARFRSFRVEARPVGSTAWSVPIDSSLAAMSDDRLARWDTAVMPEGPYDLRVAVLDTLGLVGVAQVTVIVDNLPPFADVTTPAHVSALDGGDVYTTSADVHLYFPPRAFEEDATVSIVTAAAPAPADLPPGTTAIGAAHDIFWSAPRLEKAAALDLTVPDPLPAGATGTPQLYRRGDGGTWALAGGTFDAARHVLSAPLASAGRYTLVVGAPGAASGGGLSALTFTPRVFSPTGGFATARVAIGFTLGRAGAVTVTVHDRTGRRVRTVARGESMGVGAELVYWDGRDDGGAVVEDGLYLVTVEALGDSRTRPLAVVR